MQFGQYHGAGVKTGRGLRLRHLAQRYRLPRGAVFGRMRFPDVSRFSPIGHSILSSGFSHCTHAGDHNPNLTHTKRTSAGHERPFTEYQLPVMGRSILDMPQGSRWWRMIRLSEYQFSSLAL